MLFETTSATVAATLHSFDTTSSTVNPFSDHSFSKVSTFSVTWFILVELSDTSLLPHPIMDVVTRVANSIDRTIKTDRETVVGWGMPDYSAVITMGATIQGYYSWVEIPASGIVFATSSYQNAAPTIHINKEASTNGMIAITSGYAIVEKGKFVSFAVTSGGNGYFVPFKGVN